MNERIEYNIIERTLISVNRKKRKTLITINHLYYLMHNNTLQNRTIPNKMHSETICIAINQ